MWGRRRGGSFVSAVVAVLAVVAVVLPGVRAHLPSSLTDLLPSSSGSSSSAGNSSGGGVAGCPKPEATTVRVANPSGRALDAVGRLPVKGKGACAKYERVPQFGEAWTDDNTMPGGHNGCDTRNDVLGSHLTGIRWKNAVKCKVSGGVLADQYSGRTIEFVAGRQTSSAVQIDHVVALKNAWVSGAWRLPYSTDVEGALSRVNIANDPLNLMPSDGDLNQEKSDNDASGWLPPNKGFRCAYVARQVAVKTKYGLSVTKAEKAKMVDVLNGCPSEPLPLR